MNQREERLIAEIPLKPQNYFENWKQYHSCYYNLLSIGYSRMITFNSASMAQQWYTIIRFSSDAFESVSQANHLDLIVCL